MLPLQWVAWGLLLVVVDLTLGGWDVLADPVGWVVVLVGLAQLGDVLTPALRWVAVVALVAAVATFPPGLLTLSPPLAWAVSLPEEAFSAWLAFALAAVLPDRERTLRLLGWCFVVIALTPPVVLGTESVGLVVLLAGFAVVVTICLIVVLFRAAPEVSDLADA